MHRLVENPVGVSRSYQIVSSNGTTGNPYQRLLAFTTARRKAPEGLIHVLLARYQNGRRPRRFRVAYTPAEAGAPPGDCVTLTIPDEPRRAAPQAQPGGAARRSARG
jgi:hypothetical protein